MNASSGIGCVAPCLLDSRLISKGVNCILWAMSKEVRGSRWRRVQKQFMRNARYNKLPCALCGQPINYTTRNPNDWDAPSVDHIKPWIYAPELRLDPANLQIAHQECNKIKGTGKQAMPSIGNQSRQWGKKTNE